MHPQHMNHLNEHPSLHQLGVTVFERGWLSSNNVLIRGSGLNCLVDTGYVTHAPQTVAMVQHHLGDRTLDLILNTHLHSDHCGGNAALSAHFPSARVLIPPGLASAVATWDEAALSFAPTGQQCARFTAHGLLHPGAAIALGDHEWQVHAADGHDPHSVILFERQQRVLISADALWANGFGIVFPELDDASGFNEVSATLDLIERLDPAVVIPGHGPVFTDLEAALGRARSRLSQFVADPRKHRRHALKVLIKFKLLEWQRIDRSTLGGWFNQSAYFTRIARQDGCTDTDQTLDDLLVELESVGALHRDSECIVNN